MDDTIDRLPQAHAYFDGRADWIEVNDASPRLGGETRLETLGPD